MGAPLVELDQTQLPEIKLFPVRSRYSRCPEQPRIRCIGGEYRVWAREKFIRRHPCRHHLRSLPGIELEKPTETLIADNLSLCFREGGLWK